VRFWRQHARELHQLAARREGIFYDTGFDLHSRRQFCSRFVHEVIEEATGVRVGEVETFSQLLAKQPDANVRFWRFWYFGHIPWSRETVTPASLLHSPALGIVFDGRVVFRDVHAGSGPEMTTGPGPQA
jgi:hypothetical protein